MKKAGRIPSEGRRLSGFAIVRRPVADADGRHELRIVADPWRTDGGPAGRTFWSATFDGEAEARECAGLLDAVDVLEVVGRAAAVLGPAAADSMVRELAVAARNRRDVEEARRSEAVRAAAEAAREALSIRVYDAKHGISGSPALEFRCLREAEPFLILPFGEVWERDRVWDWLRWQAGRFEDFRLRVDGIGATAVERELLHEMLVTENRVKKAGLGAGGRRPLRFWRGDEK